MLQSVARQLVEQPVGLQMKLQRLRHRPATYPVTVGVNTVLTPTVTQKRSKVELCPEEHPGLLQRPFMSIRRPFPNSLAFKDM